MIASLELGAYRGLSWLMGTSRMASFLPCPSLSAWPSRTTGSGRLANIIVAGESSEAGFERSERLC